MARPLDTACPKDFTRRLSNWDIKLFASTPTSRVSLNRVSRSPPRWAIQMAFGSQPLPNRRSSQTLWDPTSLHDAPWAIYQLSGQSNQLIGQKRHWHRVHREFRFQAYCALWLAHVLRDDFSQGPYATVGGSGRRPTAPLPRQTDECELALWRQTAFRLHRASMWG